MQEWQRIIEMSGGTLVALVALLALRLILGRRELTRLTSFELIISVSFGVIVGAVLVLKTPGLGEGVLALAILALALQLNVQRPYPWPKPAGRAKTEPTLLFYNGQYVEAGLARAQTIEEAVCTLAAKSGYSGTVGVEAIVLEPTGLMKVIGSRGVAVLGTEQLAEMARNGMAGGTR